MVCFHAQQTAEKSLKALFAVEVRYGEEFEPSLSEAVKALQTATEVHDLIAQAVQPGEPDDTTRDFRH